MAKKATAIYTENPEDYTGFKNVKTGKILSYIGIAFSIIYLLLVLWMFTTFGWEGMNDPELMQEKMLELFG